MGAKGGEAIVGETWDIAPFLGCRSGRFSHRLMRDAIETTHTIIAMLQSSLMFAMKQKLVQILSCLADFIIIAQDLRRQLCRVCF